MVAHAPRRRRPAAARVPRERRDALARFVKLPPSPLELAEKLEQLRALEAGMRITVGKITTSPGGIDTMEDLEAARIRAAATHHSD